MSVERVLSTYDAAELTSASSQYPTSVAKYRSDTCVLWPPYRLPACVLLGIYIPVNGLRGGREGFLRGGGREGGVLDDIRGGGRGS